jgi:tetratricopeptide (TPR) repeat protein
MAIAFKRPIVIVPAFLLSYALFVAWRRRTAGALEWTVLARKFLVPSAIQYGNHDLQFLHLALEELEKPQRYRLSFDETRLNSCLTIFLRAYIRADLPFVLRESPTLIETLKQFGRDLEADTIALLHDEVFIQRAENYLSLPVSFQAEALDTGVQCCMYAAKAAEQMGDQPCAASYQTRLGHGLYTVGKLEDSSAAFEAALTKWRPLAVAHPDRFLPYVAQTLINVGNALERRREFELSSKAFEECIVLLRKLSAKDCQYSTDLALALNDLGTLYLSLYQSEIAQEQFNESLAVFRQLTLYEEQPPLLLARAKALCNFTLSVADPDNEALQKSSTALNDIRQDVLDIQNLMWPSEDEIPSLTNIRVRILLNLGLVLGRLKETDKARVLLETACQTAENSGWWDLLAEIFEARTAVEQWAEDNPLKGFHHAERAVRTLEKGLVSLNSFGQVRAWEDRGSFKAKLEISYTQCLLHSAQQNDEGRVFNLLESLRNGDSLSDPLLDRSPAADEVGIEKARELVAKNKICYLAIQIVPKGAVFFSILPSAQVEISHISVGWRAKFFELFERILEINKEIELGLVDFQQISEAPHVTPTDLKTYRTLQQYQVILMDLGRELFRMMPKRVQKILTANIDNVFISAYGDLQNLPFEFLFLSSNEWAGLKHLLPRVHSFRELQTVLLRQPNNTLKSSMVVADTGNDLDHARVAAAHIVAALNQKSFTLTPRGKALIGGAATKEGFLNALKAGVSLGFYCGHGGYDTYGPFLNLANDGKVRPHDIERIHLGHHPILYYDCCQAGISNYRLGGRIAGFGVASITAGASCCLQANRPIFDTSASDLSRLFVKGLLSGNGAGESLLQARRSVATRYDSPLCWAFPVLVGNPYAHLRSAVRTRS